MRKAHAISGISLAVLAAAAMMTATDARSQQDTRPAPEVSGVTVTVQLPAIPRVGIGAPLFTAEELAAEANTARLAGSEASRNARRCDALFNDILYSNGAISLPRLYGEERGAQAALQTAAKQAEAATLALTAARVDASKGEASTAQVEAAELNRQKAVEVVLKRRREVTEAKGSIVALQQAMITVRGGMGQRQYPINGHSRLLMTEYMRQTALHPVAGSSLEVPKDFADLLLKEIKVAPSEDGKGVRVTGVLTNPRGTPIGVPPLSFTAVDEAGQRLESRMSDAYGRSRLGAGQGMPFAYDFDAPPAKTKSIVVAVSDGHGPLEPLPVGLFC